MKIPDKIKVLGHEVKILKTNAFQIGGKAGSYSSWHDVISIADDCDVTESNQAEAFQHEIIECINDKCDLNLEQRTIMTLSEVLLQIIRDNDLDFRDKEI